VYISVSKVISAEVNTVSVITVNITSAIVAIDGKVISVVTFY
jgi:hypothetical protein